MKNRALQNVVLTLLAIIFTIALTFATIWAPWMLNRFIRENFDIPDIHPIIEPELIEQFMSSNYVRLIGYACLAVVIILIVAGFLTEKRGLSSLGAIAFFLPTFGYFAAYMFFLAGLGMMRALWLPFWGNLMKLGDIAMVPYMIIVYPFSLIRLDIRSSVAYLAIGLGLLVFLLGTLAWFFAKLQRKGTVDFWLYRLSRHPQYLGWILWSYGLMLLATQAPIPLGGENPGASLPWLISSVIIVCVALGEEIRMSRERGQEYEAYRASAPFMLPLPNSISKVITAPLRALLKKDRPGNRKELVLTFVVYAAILVLLSLPFVVLNWPSRGWMDWPSYTRYREPLPPPTQEHWLSLEECRSVCGSEGYADASCLWPSEAEPDMVDVAPCVIEGSEDCGDPDQCRCYCILEIDVPDGVLSVSDLLADPVYETQVVVYGRVRRLGELRCPCFELLSGEEDEALEVWYDAMTEVDGTQWPSVSIEGIEKGDWIVVTGELRPSDGTSLGRTFWITRFEKME
jgi:protein-S-isoprenylcysteine O-methyltransferase Ste14